MKGIKMKVANQDARQYVQQCKTFVGSNTFAEYINGVYVVFSYGYHFPMFVKLGEQWFSNSEKFSRSTSKQFSQLNPLASCTPLITRDLIKLYS